MNRIRKAVAALVVAIFCSMFAPASKAQTYTATNVPFNCLAVTSRSDYPLPFSTFNCRGILFGGGVELYFVVPEIVTNGVWAVEPFQYNLTTFTQPNPISCPAVGGKQGCPAGTVPGTFAFNWSGVDTTGVTHSGSASGTWVNEQECGGRGCYWYHPVLLSVSLTIN